MKFAVSRRAFLAATAVALVGCRGATGLTGADGRDGPPGPPGPPPPPVLGAMKRLSDYGVTWQGDETAKVQAAVNDVAIYGGSLDFEGRAITLTAPITIPPTSQLIGQQRGLKIVNAMAGIIAGGDFPLFKAAPNLLVLYFGLDTVQLQGLQPTRSAPLVDYQGMSHFRFTDVWAFAPNGDGFRAVGNYAGQAPYYGTWMGCLLGCARGIVAAAFGGPSSGPNSNTVRDTRFSGCGVGIEIGPDCQNWVVTEDQFEGCGIGIEARGTRLLIGDGNRFEGSAAQVGIQLGPVSDGKVGRQYWSVGKRVTADPALDLANWVLDAQPSNQ